MAIQHSIEFVKTNSKRVGQLFSREHRQIAREFLRFRNKTLEKMDKMDDYYRNMIESEIKLAQRNPIIEAEYRMNDDPHDPLRLYDCLVPTLTNHLISRPLYEEYHHDRK